MSGKPDDKPTGSKHAAYWIQYTVLQWTTVTFDGNILIFGNAQSLPGPSGSEAHSETGLPVRHITFESRTFPTRQKTGN
jgi:hypothetical protein